MLSYCECPFFLFSCSCSFSGLIREDWFEFQRKHSSLLGGIEGDVSHVVQTDIQRLVNERCSMLHDMF